MLIIEGNTKGFRDLGTSVFTNLVKKKTRNAEAKRTLICEGVDGVPHPVHTKGEIRFCHPPGRSRLDVLDQVLQKYKVSGTGEEAIFRCNLDSLAADFWQEHVQMISDKTGKFLCRQCDDRYR
jgi:hypothetical protein